KTGEPLVDAIKKCPNITLVPPNHSLYQEYSEKFINILRDFSPEVEQYSIDEAYCNMTGMETLFGKPMEAANRIKDRIQKDLGFTVNIGISTNKLLAKMASDFKKPNMVHTLFPEEIKEKMWILPVNELFFVGKSTVNKLNNLGIYTIGELAKTDVEILKAHLKSHGEVIHSFANGVGASVIDKEEVKNKGYSNSTTIPFDVEDETTAKIILLSLAENVGARLRKDNMVANVIAVNIVDHEFHQTSHQTTLLKPTYCTNDIYQCACRLFDDTWEGNPIRNLGLQSSKVVPAVAEKQLSLFDTEIDEKKENLDKAIDSIRDRFGDGAIQRASLFHKEDE
ncbi:MAG: DNA polymerase IV, partial [Clostridiales bacterium]|nr:DNA polymerase IV [Clostridiales bacterium]